MKIYTKTGDDGTTGLFGGDRVSKNDLRVEAYGTVDEANAAIGVARAAGLIAEIDALLQSVQSDLFAIGGELATASGKLDRLPTPLVGAEHVDKLEKAIDASESALAPLRNFVLPAGTLGAAALHQARTVCRRAERRVIAARTEFAIRDEALIYLNRLSDLLFVLARRENQARGVPDVPWKPRG